MDRLTALQVFRRAAELGSFASASRDLGLSPAAVSKNIGELEAHLGVRLFHRTTRRMSLTEEGSLYYARVAVLLDELNDADGALSAMRDIPRGLLRVSAPMTLTLIRLSAAIPAFLSRNPELSMDLQLDDRRVDLVKEGFDVALRGSDHLEDSTLIARKLMTLDHVVCGAPEYFERTGVPASPAELAKHTCVRFTLSGHANEWTFKKGNRLIKVAVRGRYKVGSSLAVRDALRAGFGLSLIPRIYVEEDLLEGRLRTVLDAWSLDETHVYAVYPSQRYVVPKVRAFVDFLADELAHHE
ncbi:MAG: LysR family transcriptional regulator [Myxococcota bacterium]